MIHIEHHSLNFNIYKTSTPHFSLTNIMETGGLNSWLESHHYVAYAQAVEVNTSVERSCQYRLAILANMANKFCPHQHNIQEQGA